MRLSVTLLDSYRYWREQEFFTEEAELAAHDELVARLLGERPPQTDDMLRSIAFHSVCEEPLRYLASSRYICDGWEFDLATTNEFLLDLPAERVPEVKMEQQIGDVTLVGVADYMHGVDAGDYKLTKKVHPDKYADSIQWQAYLMMMDGERFRYHVAQPRMAKGVCRLAEISAFPFYRAPATDERVIRLVEEFAEFAAPILAEAA